MPRPCLSRTATVAALGMLCFLAPSQAVGPPETDKVKVTLVVILAGEEGKEVDPALQQIADEVRKLNPTLQRFRLKSMTNRDLAENEKAIFPLVEGKKVEVVVKHGADRESRVGLAVTPPEQGEIVYRSACGKFFPIVTRYQTKSRERLILALRVQPCPEK